MANSDTWYPTLTQAREHAAASWGVAKSAVVLDDAGEWDGEIGGDGFDVHVARHRVTLTADGVCDALTFWPNR